MVQVTRAPRAICWVGFVRHSELVAAVPLRVRRTDTEAAISALVCVRGSRRLLGLTFDASVRGGDVPRGTCDVEWNPLR